MKTVLSFQHKGLLDTLNLDGVYRCTQTRESKWKYSKMQKELELPDNEYPIWFIQPKYTDYISKGRLFKHDDTIVLSDFNKGLLSEMLFHISISCTDYDKLANLIKTSYIYELALPKSEIYEDTLEGYSICGVTKELKRSNLLQVYSISYISNDELPTHLLKSLDKDEVDYLKRKLNKGSFIRIKPLLGSELGFTNKSFIVPLPYLECKYLSDDLCSEQEGRQLEALKKINVVDLT